MTDTTLAGTEIEATDAPGPMARETNDPAATPAPFDSDAAYEWVTGLPLGRTQESSASDAPPMRPARAIAFGA